MNGIAGARWIREPDTITIALSRDDAEAFRDPDGDWLDGSTERLADACRAALKGEQ